MEDKNVDSYVDKLMKIFKDFGDLLKEKNEIITNIMNENEKLRIEKSRLSSELQALTEMYNECKKENDDLKGKKEKSKTMCDECELQHKECHCDCAREFIPKDKTKESNVNFCLYGFNTLLSMIYLPVDLFLLLLPPTVSQWERFEPKACL